MGLPAYQLRECPACRALNVARSASQTPQR
jgi:hypothetical protein